MGLPGGLGQVVVAADLAAVAAVVVAARAGDMQAVPLGVGGPRGGGGCVAPNCTVWRRIVG